MPSISKDIFPLWDLQPEEVLEEIKFGTFFEAIKNALRVQSIVPTPPAEPISARNGGDVA